MEAMLQKLEEVRLSSLDLYREQIVTALGNGKDIVGVVNQTGADYDVIIKDYLDNGYWVVNNFCNGISLGLGI